MRGRVDPTNTSRGMHLPLVDAGAAGHLRSAVLMGLILLALVWVVVPGFLHTLFFRPAAYFSGHLPDELYCQVRHLACYYSPEAVSRRERRRRGKQLQEDIMATEWPLISTLYLACALRDIVRSDPGFQEEASAILERVVGEAVSPSSYAFIEGAYDNPFDPDNELRDNELYLGYVNMTLACYREVTGRGKYDATFHRFSAALYRSVMESPTHNVEAYPGCCWPSDITTVLASLAAHDRIFGTQYGQAGEAWVSWMKQHLDERTGLMPAEIDAHTGRHLQGPRGVALGWAIPFIAEYAPNFARDQYQKAKKYLFTEKWGILGVREWPKGSNGFTDVDTGPIIAGMGIGATGLFVGPTKAMGDIGAYGRLLKACDAVAWPVTFWGRRRYVLSVRVGDSILLRAKTCQASSTVSKYQGLSTLLVPWALFWSSIFAIITVAAVRELRWRFWALRIHRGLDNNGALRAWRVRLLSSADSRRRKKLPKVQRRVGSLINSLLEIPMERRATARRRLDRGSLRTNVVALGALLCACLAIWLGQAHPGYYGVAALGTLGITTMVERSIARSVFGRG